MSGRIEFTDVQKQRFEIIIGDIQEHHHEEIEISDQISDIVRDIQKADQQAVNYGSMAIGSSRGGFSLTAFGPQGIYLRKSRELEEQRAELASKRDKIISERNEAINDLIAFYASTLNVADYELPLEAHLVIANIAKSAGSKEIALEHFHQASVMSIDPVVLTQIAISAHELGSDVFNEQYVEDRIRILGEHDPAIVREMRARFDGIKYANRASVAEDSDDMEDVESVVLGALDNRLYELQEEKIMPPLEVVNWLETLKKIVRYKTSTLATLDDEEKTDLSGKVDDLVVKGLGISFPYLSFEDGRFFPLDSDQASTTIYEKFALLHAEASFFSEIYEGKPATAIRRFDREVRDRFPESISINSFEDGMCNQLDGLCKNSELVIRNADSASSALSTAIGHMDDNSFLNEIGVTVGGGAVGGVGAWGTCVLLGVPGGPIGEGLTLTGCTALGIAGGSLLAYGGSRTSNIYNAREQIAESYDTGWSPVPPELAQTRLSMMPLEMGMLVFVGGGLLTRTGEAAATRGVISGSIRSGISRLVPRFVAEGSIGEFAGAAWDGAGKLYMRGINNKGIIGLSTAAMTYDLITDDQDRFLWEEGSGISEFDGFTHWWGFFPATLVVGNQVFPRLIKISPSGNAMGCALGTGFQIYFQYDAGRDPEYFDWNRAGAGYLFMMASTFTARTVIEGVPYWEQSIVGRAHIRAFNGLDRFIVKPTVGRVWPEAFGNGLMNRTWGRSLTQGIDRAAVTEMNNQMGGAWTVRTAREAGIDVLPGSVSHNVKGWNGMNPIFSWRGRIKLSTYNTALMGSFNIATAWAQGIDTDRSTIVRLLKMWVWNMAFGALQAEYGVDKPAGFLIGKPTGEAITWGFNIVLNMFGKQALHEYPVRVNLDVDREDHVERMTDEEKKKAILDMIRRGTMVRGATHWKREFLPETLEKFTQFFSSLSPVEKTEFQTLLASFAEDALSGDLDEGQKRAVEMMALSMLIDSIPNPVHELEIGQRKVQVRIPKQVDFDQLAHELNTGVYDNIFSPQIHDTLQVPAREEPQQEQEQ